MRWQERRFLTVQDLYNPEGPFEGLIKKDLCYKLLDQGQIVSVPSVAAGWCFGSR